MSKVTQAEHSFQYICDWDLKGKLWLKVNHVDKQETYFPCVWSLAEQSRALLLQPTAIEGLDPVSASSGVQLMRIPPVCDKRPV